MFLLQISMNVNQRVTACSNVPTLWAATPVHATSISHKILTIGKVAQVASSFFYSITEEILTIFKISIPGTMEILKFRQNGLKSISYPYPDEVDILRISFPHHVKLCGLIYIYADKFTPGLFA